MNAHRAAVRAVAAELHEQWRVGRRLPDGSLEPRWKDSDTIDIANTAFEHLPATWQQENLAAAASAVTAVTGTTLLQDAAAQIHHDWLARNGQWAPAQQQLPYVELPEVEKEKDRVVARAAASVLGVSLA